MNNSVESLLESKWKALITNADADILWIAYRSTPAFPSDWPPNSTTELIYHIYAYGDYSDFQHQIVDGEFISKPWARLHKPLTTRIQPAVEFLDDELHQIGIQGFRPLNEDELAIYEQASQVEDSFSRLLNGGTDQEYRTLKTFYKTWLGLNGVIGEETAKHHPDFFRWLKSGSQERPR
jgi:hypothetical protein